MVNALSSLDDNLAHARVRVATLLARDKHPTWPKGDLLHAAAIVGEESGELLRACMELQAHGRGSVYDVVEEALHTGATIIRFLTETDLGGALGSAEYLADSVAEALRDRLRLEAGSAHVFTDEGVCLRCGEDAEEWDGPCVEGIFAEQEAEIARLRAEIAALQAALGPVAVPPPAAPPVGPVPIGAFIKLLDAVREQNKNAPHDPEFTGMVMQVAAWIDRQQADMIGEVAGQTFALVGVDTLPDAALSASFLGSGNTLLSLRLPPGYYLVKHNGQ